MLLKRENNHQVKNKNKYIVGRIFPFLVSEYSGIGLSGRLGFAEQYCRPCFISGLVFVLINCHREQAAAIASWGPSEVRRRWHQMTRRHIKTRSNQKKRKSPDRHRWQEVSQRVLYKPHAMIWKIFCLLGSRWFLERPHLHISNLVVVDSVDIKGHNKEGILSINTIRTPLHIYFFSL